MNDSIYTDKISWEDLKRWGACYDDNRLQKWVPEPKTLLELLSLRIPSSHRIWVLHQAIMRSLAVRELLGRFAYRGMEASNPPRNLKVLAEVKAILRAVPAN